MPTLISSRSDTQIERDPTLDLTSIGAEVSRGEEAPVLTDQRAMAYLGISANRDRNQERTVTTQEMAMVAKRIFDEAAEAGSPSSNAVTHPSI